MPNPNRALLAIALFALSAAPAVSQTSTGPGGLWWEVSAAAGGSRLTCSLCDPSRILGPSVDVGVGAYASDRLRVGVEAGAVTNEDGGVRETVYRAGLTAQLHPRARSGFHVVAGLGWSGYRADEFTYDAARLTLGAGWDLPLVGSWVVGNRVTLDGAAFAPLDNGGTSVASSVGLSVLRFGVFLRRK